MAEVSEEQEYDRNRLAVWEEAEVRNHSSDAA